MPESHREKSLSDTIGVSGPGVGSSYLLVIDGDVSRRFQLPNAGAVIIGRAADCDLTVEHRSASRHHARLEVSPRQMTIADLESHNGTMVNGVGIAGIRRVNAGDVVSIGDVLMVVHIQGTRETLEAIAEKEWRHRLSGEIERATAYHRTVGIVAIDGEVDRLAQWRIEFARSLRLIDGVTRADDGQVLLLLPELERTEVAGAARRALDSIASELDSVAAAGYAVFPDDGLDVDTLLLAARTAAREAPDGQVWCLGDAARRIELGDREAVLADPSMLRQFELIERLASSELPILITGDTGTGKELAALAVHHFSNRGSGPFHAINCAAIPDNLVESEIFGHEKGAFTGAHTARPGLFEKLDGGTLFLDEIGELPLATQAKLLRVVEAGKVTRLGGVTEHSTDVRLVAATNRDLQREVEADRFREDLYFRLGVATVLLTPLSQRKCEIPILIREFVRSVNPDARISPAAMRRLLSYEWPGSVRELKNTIDYAAAAAIDPEMIDLGDLPERLLEPEGDDTTDARSDRDAADVSPKTASFRPIAEEVRELEKLRMTEALRATGGVKTRAAELISMPIRTFTAKLKQYQIRFEAE